MSQIVGLQLIAHLDVEAVELEWHHQDGTVAKTLLNGRGIFDLQEEIEALLRNCPEIHDWKTQATKQ